MKKDGGFAVFELIVLILLLCVFLAGLIFLTRDVAGSKGDTGNEPLVLEGEKLLDDLGAIFEQANAVTENPDGITVCGDLDGDGDTGCKSCSSGGTCECRSAGEDQKGLEMAEVHVKGKSGKLVADVYTDEDKPQEVVLTGYLDKGAEKPFIIRLSRTSDKSMTDKITVLITLKKDSDSKVFKRTYTLAKPITVSAGY